MHSNSCSRSDERFPARYLLPAPTFTVPNPELEMLARVVRRRATITLLTQYLESD